MPPSGGDGLCDLPNTEGARKYPVLFTTTTRGFTNAAKSLSATSYVYEFETKISAIRAFKRTSKCWVASHIQVYASMLFDPDDE